MASLLSSLSGLSGAVVPTLFKVLEENEPQIESKIVEKLKGIKTSNPTEYGVFLENWRKLNRAIEASSIETSPMQGGDDSTGPTGPEPAPLPEPSPPIIEPTGPTGPTISTEASGPSFLQESGPSGPSIVQRITEFFTPEPSPSAGGERKLFAPNGGSYKAGKRRRGKTAKQHGKRTHRVKHKKH